MKQVKMKKLTGKIKVITGLHIGAGSDTIEIGGMDNPIIRNPVNGEPYIPGSSLKGKMRSLMEWETGKVTENKGEPCSCGSCDVCRVFGSSAGRESKAGDENNVGPTRLILRDAMLSEESRKYAEQLDNLLVEEKYENSINRITARANPRPIERVVPGAIFNFELVYRVLDTDDGGNKDEKLFQNMVLRSLTLLQNDYLGGGGSRGNGKIIFEHLTDENNSSVQLPEV